MQSDKKKVNLQHFSGAFQDLTFLWEAEAEGSGVGGQPEPHKKVGDMTQRVKMCATKPNNLTCIPGTHRWEETTNYYMLSSDRHTSHRC